MSRIIFNAYSAERNGAFLQVAVMISGEPPFPSRTIEAKNVAECEAAFAVYKAEAEATGTRVTATGLAAAKKALPKCKIVGGPAPR